MLTLESQQGDDDDPCHHTEGHGADALKGGGVPKNGQEQKQNNCVDAEYCN